MESTPECCFEHGDAEASLTFPVPGHKLRCGDYMIIKDRPCKVQEIKRTKPSKHGHGKMCVVGVDIFDGKKVIAVNPTSHKVCVPHVKHVNLMLVDVDSFADTPEVSLMDPETGEVRDMNLPDTKVGRELFKTFTERSEAGERRDSVSSVTSAAPADDDRDVIVTVMEAMDRSQIISFKLGTM